MEKNIKIVVAVIISILAIFLLNNLLGITGKVTTTTDAQPTLLQKFVNFFRGDQTSLSDSGIASGTSLIPATEGETPLITPPLISADSSALCQVTDSACKEMSDLCGNADVDQKWETVTISCRKDVEVGGYATSSEITEENRAEWKKNEDPICRNKLIEKAKSLGINKECIGEKRCYIQNFKWAFTNEGDFGGCTGDYVCSYDVLVKSVLG